MAQHYYGTSHHTDKRFYTIRALNVDAEKLIVCSRAIHCASYMHLTEIKAAYFIKSTLKIQTPISEILKILVQTIGISNPIVQIMNTTVQIVTETTTIIYVKPSNTTLSPPTKIGIQFA